MAASGFENSLEMFSDSDQLRFPKRRRLLSDARISNVGPVVDDTGRFSGEHRVLAFVGSREVDVRYVETSGEFQLVAEGEVHDLSRTDLRDLANAIRRYQETVPWDDGEAGKVLVGLNELIFPSCLSAFSVRSVSDLGEVVLVAGRADRLDVDVTLNLASGELLLMVSRPGLKARKRAPTTQEAHDLSLALRPLVEGRPLSGKTALLAVVIEATRRRSMH